MGAWGAGPFENDTAADWDVEVLEADSISLIDSALAIGEGEGYLDADEGSTALAAVELVAAALGRPGADLPPDLRKWSIENAVDLTDRVDAALDALARVEGEDSELRMLWKEGGSLEEWLSNIEDTRERIMAGAKR